MYEMLSALSRNTGFIRFLRSIFKEIECEY